MNQARLNFSNGIESVNNIFSIYDHMEQNLHLPNELTSDILRSQIVYAISALDRLVHELVRIGILEIFNGTRIPTNKFNSHPFKASTLMVIMEAHRGGRIITTPEDMPEFIINKEIAEKMGFLAFQAPDKVKDALSLIWNEPHKMVVLAKEMGLSGTTDNAKQQLLEQTLNVITTRRNQIAHEADLDPVSNMKRPITRQEVSDSVNFIERLGLSICKCVTHPSCMKTTP